MAHFSAKLIAAYLLFTFVCSALQLSISNYQYARAHITSPDFAFYVSVTRSDSVASPIVNFFSNSSFEAQLNEPTGEIAVVRVNSTQSQNDSVTVEIVVPEFWSFTELVIIGRGGRLNNGTECQVSPTGSRTPTKTPSPPQTSSKTPSKTPSATTSKSNTPTISPTRSSVFPNITVPCLTTDALGNTIDLSTLRAGPPYYSGTGSSFGAYTIDICGNVQCFDQPATTGSCQDSFKLSMGNIMTQTISPQDPVSGEIVIHYSDGAPCNGARQTYIILRCDPSATGAPYFTETPYESRSRCSYYFPMAHSLACLPAQ